MSKAKSGLLILQVPEVIKTQPLLAIPICYLLNRLRGKDKLISKMVLSLYSIIFSCVTYKEI